jgi:putative transposase
MNSMIRFICGWIRVMIKISGPGGVKALAAENLLLRQQLVTIRRNCKRSPKIETSDRILYGFLSTWINSKRLSKLAIIIKPATILKFHKALVKRKYQLLFSSKSPKKPGRKGPSEELVKLIVEMKVRNPRFGYLRIAMQIQHTFGIKLDVGVIKRLLDKYLKPTNPNGSGPSWLTFIGHMKDSLWSVDLFRVESICLKSHWIMLVMDQYSREIIGLLAKPADINGNDVCFLFNQIISGRNPPKYLSSDHDPLFRFQRWKANLSILDINEIKSVPYTPTSHLSFSNY